MQILPLYSGTGIQGPSGGQELGVQGQELTFELRVAESSPVHRSAVYRAFFHINRVRAHWQAPQVGSQTLSSLPSSPPS